MDDSKQRPETPQPPTMQTGNITTGDLTGGIINVGGNQTIHLPPPTRACPIPPSKPTHFGGRDTPLADLKTRLKDGTLTAITAVHGGGGIGKTTLALQLANEVYADETFAAVLWATVGQQPDTRLILRDWLSKYCGENDFPEGSSDLAGYIRPRLEKAVREECARQGRVLLVLDDVWTGKEDAGLKCIHLLREAVPEGAAVLMTTRAHLLAVEAGADAYSLAVFEAKDGAEMLKSYRIPGATDAALQDLSVALGGHALALTLAVTLIRKALNPVAMLTKYVESVQQALLTEDVFSRLKLDEGKDKNRNLEISLALSYDDLPTDDDRWRFRSLGIAAYNAQMDAKLLGALWTCDTETAAEYANTLRLQSLLDHTLTSDVADESGLFTMHPLLRAYARALLVQDTADLAAAFARYADFVTQEALQFYELPPEQWKALDPLLPHLLDVGDELVRQARAAWGDFETVEAALTPPAGGQPAEHAGEAGAEGTPDPLTQRALAFASSTRRYLAYRREVARPAWLLLGLAAARRAGDRQRISLFLLDLGTVWSAQGDQRHALEFYEDALALFRELGDQRSEATTLNNIGAVQYVLGELQQTLYSYEDALALFQEFGDWGSESATLNNIGAVLSALGEKRRALDFYEQALLLVKAVGDRGGEATTLNNIAGVHFSEGRYQEAEDIVQKILVVVQAIGDVASEALIHANRAILLEPQNRLDEAIQEIDAALDILRRYNLPQSAGGGTVEEYEAFRAEWVRRRDGVAEDDPSELDEDKAAQGLAMLAALYKSGGADAVRSMLSEAGMPEELVDRLIQAMDQAAQSGPDGEG